MESISRITNVLLVIHLAILAQHQVQTVQLVHLVSIYRLIPVLQHVHQLILEILQLTLATLVIQTV
jgi:hypothetical protein